jgi:hypothetical protein
VRNPNFDAAMAQQRYDQMLADMTARAKAGQFDTRRDEVGQPPPQGGFGDIASKYRDLGMGGKILTPIPEGSQVGGGQGDYQFVDPQSPQGQAMQGYQQSLRDALSRYNPNAPSLMPIQTPGSNALNQDLANRGMGGGIPTPIPEAQQGQQAAMAAYNNFLQQGIQNSNTLNQGAMASFANTQPGMQVPQVPQAGAQVPQAGAQIPQPTIAKPQRPSMATQQRRPLPAPRKFSTVRNTPARFG